MHPSSAPGGACIPERNSPSPRENPVMVGIPDLQATLISNPPKPTCSHPKRLLLNDLRAFFTNYSQVHDVELFAKDFC
jgi:hypothetical protein